MADVTVWRLTHERYADPAFEEIEVELEEPFPVDRRLIPDR